MNRIEAEMDDVMKKAEEDPFGLLFGRYWKSEPDSAGVSGADRQQQSTNTKGQGTVPKAEKTVSDPGALKDDIRANRSKTRDEEQPKTKVVPMESQEQDYEIDPITMRRVPRTVSPTAPAAESKVDRLPTNSQGSSDIPIKRFRKHSEDSASSHLPSKDQTISNKTSDAPSVTPTHPQNAKSWLAREGFGRKQQVLSEKRPPPQVPEDVKPKASATKIDSALDRHLKRKSSGGDEFEQPAVQYWPKENTTDDVDLLRPSDVRASAGLRGKAAKESDAEKQARQQRLEKEYDKRSLDWDAQLAQEVPAGKPEQSGDGNAKDPMIAPWANLLTANEPSVSQNTTPADKQALEPSQHKPETPKALTSVNAAYPRQTDVIRTQLVPLKVRLDAVKADYEALRQRWLAETRREKAKKKATEIHEDEVKAQKQAMEAMEMRNARQDDAALGAGDKVEERHEPRQLQSFLPGEGDMASNVHEFAGRDRWYKRKAPHALEESVTLRKLAKDRELIREVRSIYEDRYGTIDTKHRQRAMAEEKPKTLEIPKDQVSSETASPVLLSTDAALADTDNLASLKPEDCEALATIQKLFNELRQAQTLIQEHRTSLQPEMTNEMAQASKDYQQTVLQIAKSALKLTKTSPGLPGSTLAEFFHDAGVPADSQSSTSPTTSSSSAKATATIPPKFPTPSVYRILAYDSATQKVISSPKTTSLAPFSKEQPQPLTPVEALSVLNNPGKFLPNVMNLYNKGYKVISGASNILVFEREARGDELAAAKHAEAIRYPNPVDGTVASTGNFASPTGFVNHDSPIPLEELEQHHAEETAAATEPVTGTTQDGAGKVRREEEVFSGRSRGGWQDGNGNGRRVRGKHGRRRERRWARVLVTGTVTAACCYAIGVVSETMRH